MKIGYATAAAILVVGCNVDRDGGTNVRPEPRERPTVQQKTAARPPARSGVDPSRLVLVEGRARLDVETGFLKIPGEIRNDTGQWITSACVAVRLFDAAGKEISTSSIATAVSEDLGREPGEFVYADRTFIPPGEVGVFMFMRDVKKIHGTYASHKLSVTARPAEGAPVVALRGLATPKDGDGQLGARGHIDNTGAIGCRSPKAVLGLYAADGKLIATTTAQPDETFQKMLAPRKSIAFAIASVGEPGVANVKAWADCEPVD